VDQSVKFYQELFDLSVAKYECAAKSRNCTFRILMAFGCNFKTPPTTGENAV
jgi:hypothetical protein